MAWTVTLKYITYVTFSNQMAWTVTLKYITYVTFSVVTVAGICNSVVFFVMPLPCQCEYWSVSRLRLLIGNRWMSLVPRTC